jgi:hypothetical protein
MGSLFSEEVSHILRLPNWPKGLILEIQEGELNLWLVIYRDNFERFNGEDKLYIAGMVGETINKIRKIGVPCYLEVAPGDGHGNRLDKNR